MAYTTTQTTGLGQRLGNSLKGVLFGLVLFVAGTGLLWWNEGNFVKTRAALQEAQGVTRELGDITAMDASNNGQLVHASGPTETKEILEDPFFGVSVNAIRLTRTVEYFQWTEHKSSKKTTRVGGSEVETTTYAYKQEWVKEPVESARFTDPDAPAKHKNTVLVSFEDLPPLQASDVAFGAYRLPKFLIDAIGGAESFAIEPSADAIDKLNNQLTPRAAPPPASDSPPQTASAEGAAEGGAEAAGENPPGKAEAPPPEAPRMVHVAGNEIYLGVSPELPRVGDMRIAFKKTMPAAVSLIAKVNGDTFEPYRAENGKTVGLLSMGTHSLENMYGDAHAGNEMLTWILRLAGVLCVCLCLGMLAGPLTVLASVIPFLGRLVGIGAGIVGFLLGLAWSFLIIALAWLFYRPLIGLVLLAAAAGLIWLLVVKTRSPGKATPP